MPYLTKVRMRANCDRGIWRGVCGLWLTGVSSCSWRIGAAGETIRSTRGLRADWFLGAESGTDGFADWWVCCEQCFGGLARSGDPLEIIAARVRLLLSAKQDLLRTVDSFAIIERTLRQVWQTGLGKPGRYPQACPHASTPRRRFRRRTHGAALRRRLIVTGRMPSEFFGRTR
jgi:hypothetical protein